MSVQDIILFYEMNSNAKTSSHLARRKGIYKPICNFIFHCIITLLRQLPDKLGNSEILLLILQKL